MARSNLTLQLVGSSFTLMELETFVKDCRDRGMQVDGPVSISHQEGDRQGGYEYILSITATNIAAHPKDR